ncbi:MAG: carbon-nitrogen family hydrolase [Desulfobacter sp.]|nr:MAG: carbon-nitrogen family hydrolase [Desulfobacter sp.]
MEKRGFRAAAVQFDIVNGNIEANLGTAFSYLEELADRGADLAVLPELFSCGFDNENIAVHARRTPQTLARMAQFAGSRSMALAGTLPEAEGDRVYNTLYYIDRDGQVKGGYRKLHLFRLTAEHEFYAPGDEVVFVDTGFGRIGLMICYDLRFPELARQLFLDGARLFIVSAQWPAPRVAHWQTLLRARAIENQSYMLCCNRTGSDGALEFPGSSAIVGPSGETMGQAGSDAGFITADIDTDAPARAAAQIPVAEDRRKDIYG